MVQKNKKSLDEAGVKNVLYIGEDFGYWENLKKIYDRNYSLGNFLYYQYETDSRSKYKNLFQRAYKFLPNIIYVDLSKDTVNMLKLARLLTREYKFQSSAIVGLVDSERGITEALSAKCDFVHIKCGEYFDAVYGPIRLVFPHVARDPNFARAVTEEKREILYPSRIGYMTKDYVHFESNAQISPDTEYKVTSDIAKKYLSSKSFSLLKETTEEGRYYGTKHSFNMSPQFFDKPEVLKKTEKLEAKGKKVTTDLETIELAKEEYEAGIEQSKITFEKFVLDNREDGFEKSTRIFICDPEYQILDQTDEDLSSSPYAYRLSSEFSSEFKEIKALKPQIIAVEFVTEVLDSAETGLVQEPSEENKEESSDNKEASPKTKKSKKEWIKNLEIEERKKEEEKKRSANLTMAKSLAKAISGIEKYRPVVIFFNSLYSSESLQSHCGYNLFICNKDHINLETISDMAKVFKDRVEKTRDSSLQLKVDEMRASDPEKHKSLRINDLKEKRFYISKRNPLSVAKIHQPITVIALTESEIWFKCNDVLSYGHFELEYPTKAMITLVYDKDTGGLITNINGENCYQGIFHCIDEDGKKDIRKMVNQIFFTDLINQRKIETLEYEKVTKEALDKKLNELEEMKKLLEMAEIKKSSNG
tara:strand:- start:4964 stop:6901 length:1938 start_codon:yes stop_codon:yes gene_type:complete